MRFAIQSTLVYMQISKVMLYVWGINLALIHVLEGMLPALVLNHVEEVVVLLLEMPHALGNTLAFVQVLVAMLFAQNITVAMRLRISTIT